VIKGIITYSSLARTFRFSARGKGTKRRDANSWWGEYAEDDEEPTLTRGVTKEEFEAELAKDLVVPRRLLQVRYNLPLERGDVLRYPYGWGVTKQ
jgi:hypothetical protein